MYAMVNHKPKKFIEMKSHVFQGRAWKIPILGTVKKDMSWQLY